MEIAIPIIALGGLYVVSSQKRKNCTPSQSENFEQRIIPENNNIDLSITDQNTMSSPPLHNITELNIAGYNGGNAMDKFFNPASPEYAATHAEYAGTSQQQQSQYKSLAGTTVDTTHFKHNNMVPYFGSHVRERNVDATNQQESLLDNYLGNGSQYIDKREQAPLFSPNENYNWTFGTPNANEFMRSRVNPSNKFSNVLPFQQETVGPGLGLGYGSLPSGGYNSGMQERDQWLPKTVDQLRATTNQKAGGIALLGHEGPAMTRNPTMGSIGTVEKNRPDGSFEVGQNRWLNTTGAHKGQTLRPIENDRVTSRQNTTVDYTGVASASNTGAHVDGEYMPSTRIELGAVPFTAASAVGNGGARDTDYEAKSQIVYMNNRAANQNNGYFGVLGSAIGATISPLLDAIRPTRKSNVIGTLRPYGDAGTAVSNSYLFNPADRPGTTIRETTENSKFHLNVNANQQGGAYKVTAQQPIENNRMNQSDFFYAGNSSASGNSVKPRPYDAEYRQHNNEVKSSTIAGRLVPGNMAIMNNHMNITQKDRNDDLAINRAPVPVLNYQSPSADQFGQLQGKQTLYSNIQLDRNQGDVLKSLQGNPYVLNMTKGL